MLANLHTIVEHISDQIGLWYDMLLQRGYLGYIGRLRGLNVKEWHEDADLEHVKELFVKGFPCYFLVEQGLVVKNLDLVLLDEE